MPNLWNDRYVFQVDGNFGYTAAVAEMLLQSHDGIELLPALPKAWKNGAYAGLTARGGFRVDVAWQDGRLEKAAIHSTLGGMLYITCPDIDAYGLHLEDGTPVAVTREKNHRLSLQTTPGQTIILER